MIDVSGEYLCLGYLISTIQKRSKGMDESTDLPAVITARASPFSQSISNALPPSIFDPSMSQ